MGSQSSKKSKVEWTEKNLEEEIDRLKPRDASDVIVTHRSRPLKGRPSPQGDLVKTNLDLPLNIVDQLDKIAKEYGMTRQGVIKHYLMNGMERYYEIEKLKAKHERKGKVGSV